MGIKLTDQNFCPYSKEYVKEYIVDTDADFANLPADACTGSTAVSLASGTVKVVNTAGEWVTFGG